MIQFCPNRSHDSSLREGNQLSFAAWLLAKGKTSVVTREGSHAGSLFNSWGRRKILYAPREKDPPV
jgi:hypothetical protein